MHRQHLCSGPLGSIRLVEVARRVVGNSGSSAVGVERLDLEGWVFYGEGGRGHLG